MSAARFDPIRFAREQAARKVLRDALAAVWSGADFLDADAVIDQLDDRGYLVVRKWRVEDLWTDTPDGRLVQMPEDL